MTTKYLLIRLTPTQAQTILLALEAAKERSEDAVKQIEAPLDKKQAEISLQIYTHARNTFKKAIDEASSVEKSP